MKLAYADKTFADPAVLAVQDTGLRYVEVALDAIDVDVSVVGAIRDRCDAAGLGVAGVRVKGPLATEPLADVDEDVFASVVALGTETCLLPLVVSCDEGPQRKQQLEVIRRLGDLAAGQGLRIAVELYESNLPGTHYADARAMCRLAADIEHENVGLGFDTGRFIRQHHTSSIDIALQRVLPWLVALRLGDHSGTPGDDQLLPLGDGVVLDGCRVREILTTQRYTGPVVIHVEGDSGADEALRTSVAYLRVCGWRIDR